MKKKVDCIMVIDDNAHDNFFHERVIRKGGYSENVVVRESALEALEYLQEHKEEAYVRPTIIFLDINMPRMNGWEFLEEYERLKDDLKGEYVIVMLTTSDNPDDIERVDEIQTVSGFKTKPLTPGHLENVIENILN